MFLISVQQIFPPGLLFLRSEEATINFENNSSPWVYAVCAIVFQAQNLSVCTHPSPWLPPPFPPRRNKLTDISSVLLIPSIVRLDIKHFKTSKRS